MKYNLRNINNTLLKSLKQGITPRKLALTCSLGIVLGLFPVLGTTTLLCLAASLLLRLNIPLIQLVNYLVAPLQLILIVPFIKIGSTLFGLQTFPYSSEQFIAMLRHDFWQVVQEAGYALAIAIGVWGLFSIPIFFLFFFTGLWIFQKWTANHRELKSQ
jgi:uncharacterized protein (DUF2062 family)